MIIFNLELFQTFEEPAIIFRKSVTVAVLTIYTWSILQFTVIATATVKDEQEESSTNEDIERTGDTSTSKKVLQNNNVWNFHEQSFHEAFLLALLFLKKKLISRKTNISVINRFHNMLNLTNTKRNCAVPSLKGHPHKHKHIWR